MYYLNSFYNEQDLIEASPTILSSAAMNDFKKI